MTFSTNCNAHFSVCIYYSTVSLYVYHLKEIITFQTRASSLTYSHSPWLTDISRNPQTPGSLHTCREARFSNGSSFGFRGFGDLFADYGYPLFHYAPQILVMHPFFVMCHQNIVMHQCIMKKQAHYKKQVGAL